MLRRWPKLAAAYEDRNGAGMERVQGRRRVHERGGRGGGAGPAKPKRRAHGVAGGGRRVPRGKSGGDGGRRADEMGDLVERLVEDDFLEAASDFFPFPLRGLGELVGVGAEALVEQAEGEERLAAAAGGDFGQLLEEEDVLALGVEGGEFEELA